MNPEVDFRNFFGEVTKKEDLDLDMLYFIMVSEWHWSQNDIECADIPFVFSLLLKRKEQYDREQKEQEALKKNKRR